MAAPLCAPCSLLTHAWEFGTRSSLTEHSKIEVPLGAARLVLSPAAIEARVTLLDPGEVEGPGAIQEAMVTSLWDLRTRGQREYMINEGTEAGGAVW